MSNPSLCVLVLALIHVAPSMAQDRPGVGAYDMSYTHYVPAGWSTGGNAELDYGTLFGGVPEGKRAAVIWSSTKMSEDEFGTLMQTIAADAYRGRHVRLSAMMSAEKSLASGRAALWIRVNDESGNIAAFDTMETRLVTAGAGWSRQELMLEIPAQAASITFGALLAGGSDRCCWGRLAVSDFRLETVGSDVATTPVPATILPDAPVNADFSKQ